MSTPSFVSHPFLIPKQSKKDMSGEESMILSYIQAAATEGAPIITIRSLCY